MRILISAIRVVPVILVVNLAACQSSHKPADPGPESLRQVSQRTSAALTTIRENYVDPVDDNKLVAACLARIHQQSSVHFDSAQVVAVEPASDGGSEKALLTMFEVLQKENPELADWSASGNACVRGMVEALHGRSSYLDEIEFAELTVGSPAAAGIGLELESKEGAVKVVKSVEGTPAERAGLRRGDVIIKINDVTLGDASLQEVINLLRGKAGTTLRLSYVRQKDQPPVEIELTREVIKVESVQWELIPGGYANLRIRQFGEYTGELVAKALRKADQRASGELKGVILDLRDNTGGLLPTCIGVAAVFLPQSALVATTKGRSKDSNVQFLATPQYYLYGTHVDYLKDLPRGIKRIPVAVLVNRNTAAGSEIVAAALQDSGRAVVLGERTYANGTIQTIIPLARHTALKLTTARVYRPNGEPFEPTGVTPDVPLKPADELPRFGSMDDPALIAGIAKLREQKSQGQRSNPDSPIRN
jgi:carboxyl-terminal processing protease